MLDAKDLKILTYIDKNRDWKSVVSLVKKLGFSRGDFYYHINHINKFLVENGHEEVDFSSKNRTIDYKTLKEVWTGFIKESNNYSLTSNERMWFLLVLIAIEGKVTLKEISKFFKMSVNNAYIDIKNCVHEIIYNYHNHYEISIANLGKGYSLIGDENEVYRILFYACSQIVASEGADIIISILLFNLVKFSENEDHSEINNIYSTLSRILKRRFATEQDKFQKMNQIALFISILIISRTDKMKSKFSFKKSDDFIYTFKTLVCFKEANKIIEELKNLTSINFEIKEDVIMILSSLIFDETAEYLFIENENKLVGFWSSFSEMLKKDGYELDSIVKGERLFNYLLSLKYNVTNDFDFWHERKFTLEKDYVIYVDFMHKHRDLLDVFAKFIKRDFLDCEDENIIYLIYKNILNIYAEKIITSDKITIITDMEEECVVGYIEYILKKYKNANINNILTLEQYNQNKDLFEDHLLISDYNDKEITRNFIHIPYKAKNIRTSNLILKKEIGIILEDKELTNDDKVSLLLNLISI